MEALTREGPRRLRPLVRRLAKSTVIELERRLDAARLARRSGRPPGHFRVVSYGGHGTARGVVIRGRTLDNPEPPAARAGEGVWAALRRTTARFLTLDLPGVPLRIRIGAAQIDVETDAEGYFEVRVDPRLEEDSGPWATGEVGLAAPYRGLSSAPATPIEVRIPGPGAAYGVITDVDDTLLDTGAQRAAEMVRRTLTGSALTRTPLAGAPELYRAFARGTGTVENPIFYVSSSPWNLHDFLVAFLRHRSFPAGPLLLRDLLGSDVDRSHSTTKHQAIAEVLALHPGLPFVLIGDSGQHDAEIYAEVVARHPDRIRAVYIREVRLDPGDGRVEAITGSWGADVPIVVAHDSAAIAEHAAALGLVRAEDARAIGHAAAAAA